MGLHGKHILIDGYNLERRQGTGIKTYGQGLVRALHGLGAEVGVLWSARRSRDPILQDALLYEERQSHIDWVQTAATMARALVRLPMRATLGRSTGWVTPPPHSDNVYGSLDRAYFAPGCYALAHRLARHTGLSLHVRLPDRVDAWHATCPLPIRVRGARQLTTVQDLIPLKLPWTTLDDRLLYHRVLKMSLSHSDLVLTSSESARNDLLEVCAAPEDRVEVLYPCVAAPSAPLPEDVLTRQLRIYRLRPQAYLLFVGTIEPRKNIGRLCQALSRLGRAPKVVLVGPRGWHAREELRYARPLQARGRAIVLDFVPREHLQALFQGALLFVFPSLYEGFGLPPLEAMAHGCPVLTSHNSSLSEVCGDAAVFADAYNVDDLADKIDGLIRDEGLRERMRLKGREQAERFSEARHRERLLELYGKVLG